MEYDGKEPKIPERKEIIENKKAIFREWSFFIGFTVERIAEVYDTKR